MYASDPPRRSNGDRLRLWIAISATVVALPLLWNGRDSEDTSAPTQVAAIAPEGGFATGGGETSEITEVPPTAAAPGYLGGPQSAPPPAQVNVAVGTPPSPNQVSGKASYHRWPPDTAVPNPCAAPDAPYLATITVTNLDNGQTIECVNTTTKRLDDLVLVLHTDLFLLLSDLPEAPIPVSISW
jgi:hypothetical protein